MIKKIFIYATILSFIWSCQTTEKIEDIDFLSVRQGKYYPYNNKKSKELISIAENLDKESISYSGDFTIKIVTGSKVKEILNLEGKVYFSKPLNKIKILLSDAFFGLTFAKVISDRDKIEIRSSGSSNIHYQPMDDISLVDPKTKKTTVVPFPIIFYSLTSSFIEDFQKNKSYFSPEESRVLVKRGADEYQYVFDGGKLESLEFYSKSKNMKAIAVMKENIIHPPRKLITKVTNLKTDEETNLISIQFKSLKRGIDIPESVFRF
ncbi:MAG: hypothetical protein L6Q54_04220 [Leptospiraceae bacterium]|nr:hypothetical protein [Leptospiraceae bacterium]MCK6380440.1 hypothetical protein [Leptospiraceae bacterium]NUM40694.1 hypothetical protein [Leptospiraceae bacterium]